MTNLSTFQEKQIRDLVDVDKKIAAIKLYREYTGAGLREAKEAIEALEANAPIKFPSPPQAGKPDPVLRNRIERLLAERKKIEAVKVYREAFHCGLKEAKEAVERIQEEMHKEGFSSIPSAPAVDIDPFAEDVNGVGRSLVIFIALILLAAGLLAAFFFLR